MLISTGSPRVRRAATRGPKDQWEKVSNERVLSDVFNIVQSAVRARVGGVCVVQTSTSKNNSVDRSQATVMEKWTTTTTTHHRLRTDRLDVSDPPVRHGHWRGWRLWLGDVAHMAAVAPAAVSCGCLRRHVCARLCRVSREMLHSVRDCGFLPHMRCSCCPTQQV